MEISLWTTPIASPVMIGLTVLFVITAAILTFDYRPIQVKRARFLPPEQLQLPLWLRIMRVIHWGLGLALFLLNWKWALLVFVLKFILSFFPVFERIRYLLMSPFRSRKK